MQGNWAGDYFYGGDEIKGIAERIRKLENDGVKALNEKRNKNRGLRFLIDVFRKIIAHNSENYRDRLLSGFFGLNSSSGMANIDNRAISICKSFLKFFKTGLKKDFANSVNTILENKKYLRLALHIDLTSTRNNGVWYAKRLKNSFPNDPEMGLAMIMLIYFLQHLDTDSLENLEASYKQCMNAIREDNTIPAAIHRKMVKLTPTLK